MGELLVASLLMFSTVSASEGGLVLDQEGREFTVSGWTFRADIKCRPRGGE